MLGNSYRNKWAGSIFFSHPPAEKHSHRLEVTLHWHLLPSLLAVCLAHDFSWGHAHSMPTGLGCWAWCKFCLFHAASAQLWPPCANPLVGTMLQTSGLRLVAQCKICYQPTVPKSMPLHNQPIWVFLTSQRRNAACKSQCTFLDWKEMILRLNNRMKATLRRCCWSNRF